MIYSTADSTKLFMGLTTWKQAPHGKLPKSDVTIAKNYLGEAHVNEPNRIVSAYLNLAEKFCDEATAKHCQAETDALSVLLKAFIDLRNQRVTFRGHEIPATPPNHIQPQALLALAAVAQHAREAVSMAEVAKGIWELGGLAKRATGPEQRGLEYKLTNPFARALPNGEAKKLIEAVPGTGLRLNLRPEAVWVVLRDGSGDGAGDS
jgi:hypothetical protein